MKKFQMPKYIPWRERTSSMKSSLVLSIVIAVLVAFLISILIYFWKAVSDLQGVLLGASPIFLGVIGTLVIVVLITELYEALFACKPSHHEQQQMNRHRAYAQIRPKSKNHLERTVLEYAQHIENGYQDCKGNHYRPVQYKSMMSAFYFIRNIINKDNIPLRVRVNILGEIEFGWYHDGDNNMEITFMVNPDGISTKCVATVAARRTHFISKGILAKVDRQKISTMLTKIT